MVDYPIRAGVFDDVSNARRLVSSLRENDFTWQEVSVLCSDKRVRDMFPEAARLPPAADHTQTALNVTGLGLLGLGGAAVVTAMVSATGVGLLAMGAFTGIAAASTFASVMLARGFDSEATDYYEQALESGKILVVVEVSGDTPEAEQRRVLADRLIEAAGAETLKLAH